MARVMVGMSGGVDSSVAAYLLRAQGHDVVGVTMLLHGGDVAPGQDPARANTCCSLDDVEDAREVARQLGIPHHAFDFTEEFERGVVNPFAAAYEAGLTPNPCVACNRLVKFGALLRRARELGCDFLATGHYAQVVHPDSGGAAGGDGGAAPRRHLLAKAADAAKDQSYFLCLLTQAQLARVLLPLGGLSKPQVRVLAEEQGIVTARKRESQDVCFVPDGDVVGFLERRRGAPFDPGDVLTRDGRAVGRHRGAAGYTIGQRKGLGVALGAPVFVCAKDMVANTVTVGPAEALLARGCVVEGWNWVARVPGSGEAVRTRVRTHYRHPEQPALVTPLPAGDGEAPRVRVEFDKPQRAITPGQAAVAYDGDVLLGGGVIREALP